MSFTDPSGSAGPGKITAAVRYIAESFNGMTQALGQIDLVKHTRIVTTTTDSALANDTTLIFEAPGDVTETLDAAARPGKVLYMANNSSFAVNSASANVVPLGGGAPGTAILPGVIGAFAVLQFDGTNWITIQSSSGTWINTYNPQTGDYTVQVSDNATSIVLNDDVCYTLTFDAPSAYSPTFFVFVVNNSTNRAKIIDFNGIFTQFLWPLQCGFVVSENGLWQNTFPVRWAPGAGVTFFIDSSLGSDLNDGLAAGAGNALQTIQQGVQYIAQFLDPGGFAQNIQLADGTYAPGTSTVVLVDEALRSTLVNITGNTGAPGNVIVACPAGGTVFSVQDGAVTILDGMTISTAGNGSTGIFCRQLAICDFGRVIFTNFPLGFHVLCTNRASVNVLNNYAIFGNASSHLSITDGAFFSATSFTCTVLAGLTFTDFIVADGFGQVKQGITYIGGGAGAGTTAQQWSLGILSYLAQNGSIVPGNVAGTPAPGALSATGSYVQ